MKTEELFNVPGLQYVAEVVHEQVNHGEPLPCFMPVVAMGKPDINTEEGWNAVADKLNGKAFVSVMGRGPRNRSELYSWVNQISARLEA